MYFPSKGVRYIALNDGVDTLSNDNDIAPFKNILNEFYCRDISNKVRSAVRTRKQNGEYLSSLAPIGYQKDPKDIHRLIIEETGAAVVQRIFEMARDGLGTKKICKALNAENIPTPRNHRRLLLHGSELKPAKWGTVTVAGILRNRTYVGDTVQGIYDCPRFKRAPNKLKPKDEWIIVPGTHEPLVSVETWELVQKLIDERHRPTKNHIIQLFSGFVKCEDCGSVLGYSNSKGLESYCCGKYRRDGSDSCSSHYIRKDTLERVVLDDIRRYSELAKDKSDALVRQIQKQSGENNARTVRSLAAELTKLKTRYAELDGILKRLYEDNISGKLTDERFGKFLADYETEQSDVRVKAEDTEQKIEELQANQKDADSWIKLIRKYTSINELDRTVLCELVDKITVGEAKMIDGQKTVAITIYYRFVGAVA